MSIQEERHHFERREIETVGQLAHLYWVAFIRGPTSPAKDSLRLDERKQEAFCLELNAVEISCARLMEATGLWWNASMNSKDFWVYRLAYNMMHLFLVLFSFGGGSSAATIACSSQCCSVVSIEDDQNDADSGKSQITYLIEHVFEFILRQRRALDVLDSPELLGHSLPRFSRNRLHLLLGEFVPYAQVVSQVHLGADDKAWHAGTVVMHFREPLFADVFKRCR
jgi:hypothetical protein